MAVDRVSFEAYLKDFRECQQYWFNWRLLFNATSLLLKTMHRSQGISYVKWGGTTLVDRCRSADEELTLRGTHFLKRGDPEWDWNFKIFSKFSIFFPKFSKKGILRGTDFPILVFLRPYLGLVKVKKDTLTSRKSPNPFLPKYSPPRGSDKFCPIQSLGIGPFIILLGSQGMEFKI